MIRKPPIPLCAMIWPTPSNYFRCTSAVRFCFAARMGLSHDEAARVLEIPLGTVKTNVLKEQEELKRALAAWGPN